MRTNNTLATFQNKKLLKIIGGIGVLLILILISRKAFSSDQNNSGSTPSTNSSNNSASKQTTLDSTLEIPLDSKENITFKIETAETKKQIVLKGQQATAVEGRKFLILNVKLSNPTEQRIRLDTRDYVRLTIPEVSEDKLPPSIHNDPVEVQPISDQYTRLGFSVPENQTKFKLLVGEISEDKTEVEVNLE